MVTVAEAYRIIHQVRPALQIEQVDLLSSIGRVLAESIQADRDFPPFNRVAMDGIAIQAEQFKGNGQAFLIEGTQAAGTPQLKLKNKDNCIEVMTGSVLPENTNTVIRYEDLEIRNNVAKILIDKVEKSTSVHRQAHDAKQGDILLNVGQKISSAEVALFSSVGKRFVNVFAFPKTAVISSGDELVEIEETPALHQIRRSNTYALQAAMLEIGWRSESFHLLDDKQMVKNNLRTILDHVNVVILSGGVSKGKFDFIPEALEELGIQKLFHQVSQRPGKPFWFGASADHSKIVFALPGNPVSTFMCFYKYIKPWMLNCFGAADHVETATLVNDFNFNPSLTFFLQVKIERRDGALMAYSKTGGGSGDFANLKDVDGFLELPLEKSAFKAGETYPFISFR